MTVQAATASRRHARLRRDVAPELNELTWAAWLGAGLIMVLLISNPLYIGLMLCCALVVYVSQRTAGHRMIDVLLVGGTVVALMTVPLNLLTGTTGATRLVELPSLTLPGWLASVTFGGIVTAESLVYTLTHVAAIVAIVALVCSFNVSVDHFKLLKHTPPGLAQLGVIVTISLLLVPETLRRVVTLRESRIVRGYRFGVGSLPGLLLPLLADALERSVQRAESLDARGFGSLSAPSRPMETLAAVVSLVVAATSCFLYYYYPAWHVAAAAGVVLGVFGMLGVGWRQTRRARTTLLFRQHFSTIDWIVGGGSVGAAAIIMMCRALGTGRVTYLPFPSLTVPSFQVIPAAACLLLLSPILVARSSRR